MESTATPTPLSKNAKLRLFKKLYKSRLLSNSSKEIRRKKRFSLEGGETMIPMLI